MSTPIYDDLCQTLTDPGTTDDEEGLADEDA